MELEVKNLFEAHKILIGKMEMRKGEELGTLKLNYSEKAKTNLSKILEQEGSDKATIHSYDLIYEPILENLGDKIRIVEIGIGSSDPGSKGFMGKGYSAGASLRAWKKFKPNAEVIGADIDHSTLAPQIGLELKFVDQLDQESLSKFSEFLGINSCDLIIDDGLHNPLAAINTITALWRNIRPNGYYVIEDMSRITKSFYINLASILPDSKVAFIDMSKKKNRATNCMCIYRKNAEGI
jgi:hypothetical protein